MKRSMIGWTYRMGFLVLVLGAFAGAHGCGLEMQGCADTLTCDSAGPVTSGDENCENGKDDDGDGKADCADSNCANLVVCNAPEDGWEYATLQMAGYNANAVAVKCSDGSSAEHLFDGHNGQPSCEDCTCSKSNAQADLTCDGLPELECTTNFQGDNTTWTTIASNSNLMCQSPAGLTDMTYCKIKAPVYVTAQSCIAGGGALVDTPAWTHDVFSCLTAQNAHMDEVGICLRHDGDIPTCPNGYAQKTVVYKSETGTRACTQCDCTSECPTRIEVYDSVNCAGSAKHVLAQEKYVQTYVSDGKYSIEKVQPVAPDKCPALPTGGEPVEEVKPTGPVTFCCKLLQMNP